MACNCSGTKEYVRYKSAVTSLQNLLGLSCIDYFDSDVLFPYIFAITEYINSELILSGASTTYQALEEFVGIFEDDTNLILSGGLQDLYYKMGVTIDEDWDDKFFCLAWGNWMTSVYSSIKCSYAGALASSDSDCSCDCGCSSSTDTTDTDDQTLWQKLVSGFLGTSTSTSSSSSSTSTSSGCGCSNS